MKSPKILIVDDDASVRYILERTLRQEGYILDSAADGIDAIQKLEVGDYALVLLDLNITPLNGMQILARLRQFNTQTVVIILTAHSSIESAVEALRLGAFDYLFKPATPESIRIRVSAGLKQYEQISRKAQLISQLDQLRQTLAEIDSSSGSMPGNAESRFLRSGKMVIDRHHRAAAFDGILLNLTTTEINFLIALVEASPNPVDSRQLISYALSYDCSDAEARELAKWHIHQLRQKIEPDPANPRYIRTVRYKGYYWSGT